MYDVIIVGSATIDAFAKVDKSLIRSGNYCLPMNGKVLVDDFEIHTGGGGTNVAVGLARLGLKTAVITKIGCKDNAQRILKKLKNENVDALVTCSKNGRTPFSIIVDARGYDRSILVFKGSNDYLEYSEINKSVLKTKWFYFCSMTGKSYSTLVKLAKYAEQKDIRVMFNPSSYMIKKHNLKPVLERTDILILNKDEAMMLSKKKKMKDILEKISFMGPNGVVITDGPKMIYAYDGDVIYKYAPHKTSKVVETTGAGDAFGSGFLAGLMKTGEIRKAIKLGNMNSEACIKRTGAKESLLKWKDVKNKL